MYCNKLKEILNHEESITHLIDISVIQKLDLFLRKNVTIDELTRINAAKFSYEMKVNYDTTLRLFTIGKKVGLFQPIAYYRCQCGEMFQIYSKNKPIECSCGCNIVPNDNKNRIYVFFSLNYPVEDCDFFNHDTCVADIIDDEDLGKPTASYSDFEEVLGDAEAETLLKHRENKYRDYLRE